MVKPGDIIEFDKIKKFVHVKSLGAGGTGDTHLVLDETTDMYFAFKKYAPKDSNYKNEFYERFVDEIKILFKISHPNIVRIYNYYLYPEVKLGYLQMEYINGSPINEFLPVLSDKNWEDIFIEVISAFRYLETLNILHRDIRPANIMIDKDENVKVIDFGFGKQLTEDINDAESIFLNWPVSRSPEEIEIHQKYNHKSEIYFIGKLFISLLSEEELLNFKFSHILEKMNKWNFDNRINSFRDIELEISQGTLTEMEFERKEIEIYQTMIDALESVIGNFYDEYRFQHLVTDVKADLYNIIRTNALEECVQDNGKLIQCFVLGRFSFYKSVQINVTVVADFHQLLIDLPSYESKIVLDNVINRLNTIELTIDENDLPF